MLKHVKHIIIVLGFVLYSLNSTLQQKRVNLTANFRSYLTKFDCPLSNLAKFDRNLLVLNSLVKFNIFGHI